MATQIFCTSKWWAVYLQITGQLYQMLKLTFKLLKKFLQLIKKLSGIEFGSLSSFLRTVIINPLKYKINGLFM